MKQKDIALLAELRKNARETLTNISRRTNIPVSTVFDRLKMHENGLIKKHTTLLDFSRLGYSTKATITMRVHKDDRDNLRTHLLLHRNVNTLYRINNGYDFQIEAIFRNFKELELFLDDLDEKYRVGTRQVYYIIEDIKKEDFMSTTENPASIA